MKKNKNAFINFYQKSKKFLLKNTKHYVNLGIVNNYANSLGYGIENLEHADISVRLKDLQSEYLDYIDIGLHMKRYDYINNTKNKVFYDATVDKIVGSVIYKTENI